MKKLIIATLSLLSLLPIKPVLAKDLIHIATGKDGSDYYVNRKFMRTYPEMVGFLYTIKYKEPNQRGVLFVNYTLLAECKFKNIIVRQVDEYGEDYKEISSGKYKEEQSPSEGSINYEAVKTVCIILGVD
jgi:hypothetical protein